jgi:hypothetical protein
MKRSERIGRVAMLTAVLWVASVCFAGNLARAQTVIKTNTKWPQQVLIIRHAEKTGEKDDIHLSREGKERAEVLYRLFVASKDRPAPFPTPDFVFAAIRHKVSQRPLETVTPLAERLKLPINQTYDSKLSSKVSKKGVKDNAAKNPGPLELRDEIFGQPKYYGKVILVSWRHSTISDLAKALKASNVPAKWEDHDFDRVWQISYDDQGNATFLDRPQRLLPGDAEK